MAVLEIQIEEPKLPKWHKADDEERKRFHRVDGRTSQVMIDDDERYIEKEDRYSDAVKVRCPHCGRNNAPLLSKTTAFIDMDWFWVGIDHKEPRVGFLCVCPGCKQDYSLRICIPQ